MSNPTPPPYPQQPVYAQQPAPAAPPAPSYPPQPPARTLPTTLAHTNTFALVAIILAFLQPIAGIVFGHIALGQIKRNGDTGRGLALTGLIIGYIYVAFIVFAFIAYISIVAMAFAAIGSSIDNYY